MITETRQKEYWNNRYQTKDDPWDKQTSPPALHKLLSNASPIPIPKTGRFFVPGCGSGYDIHLLVENGPERECVGLDFSDEAIVRAKKAFEESGLVKKGNVNFVQADFFNFIDDKFDVIFDYTFFCAIPVDWRQKWGEKMAELVKPDGFLICLMFPLTLSGDGDDLGNNSGPPFLVSLDNYRGVLGDFELVLCEDTESYVSRKGREKIAVWKRK